MSQSLFAILLNTIISATSVTNDTYLIKQADFLTSQNPNCEAVLYHSPEIDMPILQEYIEAYTFSCEYFDDIQPMEIWLTANNESAAA